MVKETYLRVIEETIAGSRAQFEDEENLSERLSSALDLVRERWQARLLETHDFTADPSAQVKGTAARSGAGGSRSGAKSETATGASGSASEGGAKPGGTNGAAAPKAGSKAAGANGASRARPTGGVSSGGAHDAAAGSAGPSELDAASNPGLPAEAVSDATASGVASPSVVGTIPQGDGRGGAGDSDDSDGDDGDEPPSKRARTSDDAVNDNEDLGSDDSDDELDSGGSDDETENCIVAQHDSVKKGTGNGKWKVRLKDGIIHMNGRDYLFNKASCDLDW